MRKSSPTQYVIRVLCYVLGLFSIAFGVAVSINSNLGISPVNSLPYVVGQIIDVELGTCVTVIFCFYVFLQFLILRKDFHPINCLQILFYFIFGYFTDFMKVLVGTWALPGYPGRLVMMAISMFFIALGIVFYVESDLVPMPMEGLVLTFARKVGKPFPAMKTVIDCVVVSTGIILSFVFLGGLVGIREGTVISALGTGKIVALLRKPILPVLERICFPAEKAAAEK